MHPDDEQRWQALEGAMRDLARRQDELEQRLANVEQVRTEPPAASPAPRPDTRGRELETRMGLTWVNRIGVVTLVLGVAFFFKYAVDNRWIGETARVALGVSAGFAGLALGERLWRGGQRVYAHGISGVGIAILYVSFYASAGFYRVLSVPAAFALMTAVTAGAGMLSIRYGSAAIAALGLIGGYQTPVVLDARAAGPWFFLCYVLLLDIGARLLARARRWRYLDVLAFAATVLLFFTQTGSSPDAEKRVGFTAFNLVFAALFTGVPGRAIPALAQGAALLWAWAAWRGGSGAVWEQAALLLLGAAMAGAQAAWTPASARSKEWIAGLGAAFLAVAAPAALAGRAATIAWCVLGAALAWSAGKTRSFRLGDAALATLSIVVLRLYAADLGAARGPRFAAFTVAALSFWFAASRMSAGAQALAVYVAGHIHMLTVLGAELLDWNRRTTARESLASVNSASISVLMGAYALVLVALGVKGSSVVNRVLGLALTGLVVLKLYLYDVWQLSRIYRFSAFALLGLLLLLTSYLYSRFRAARSGRQVR